MAKLFVYGTLRNPEHPLMKDNKLLHENVKVYNCRLFDLGPFPGVTVGWGANEFVVGSVYDVKNMKELDAYEGYEEDDPVHSLYYRQRCYWGEDPGSNKSNIANIYIYNGRPPAANKVEGGEWRKIHI